MHAPGFWWKRDSILAGILSPLGAIYGSIAAARLRRPSFRAGVPVICVGNFVAGGAGKTPVALAIAEKLIALGQRPVFLTRGYGGTLRGPALVDRALHDARQTGDEPQLLAAHGPTVVSARRDEGAKLAATRGDVIVMDDGLQNPSLAKTLSIAVVDGATGLGNHRCIPAGPLRAPMAVQWGLVQAVVVLGEGRPGEEVAEEAARKGVPVLHAALRPAGDSLHLRGKRVYAFAGIGRPDKVFQTLRDLGADVVRSRSFGDHQPYSARTLAGMAEEAARAGLVLVTTEKDMARIRAVAPTFVEKIQTIRVRAEFIPSDALDPLLATALSAT